MSLETDDELEARLEQPDLSIYKEKYKKQPTGFDYTPHCIYFYYVRINRNGALAVDHYLYGHNENRHYTSNPKEWVKIEPTEVAELSRKLALNARPSTKNKSPKKLPERNFETIIWNRRSHIAFFFDERNWSFHTKSDKIPAVVFKDDEPGCDPNEAFFDGEDMMIDMGGGDMRSAVRFINHMTKNKKGDVLGHKERRNYKMDFLLRVAFAKAGKENKLLTVIFDPPGGNQGPPEQP